MRKLIICAILFISIFSLSSCSGRFDEKDTENYYCQIVLSNNDKINLVLYYNKAPQTVTNFVNLAKEGFYDNTIFQRVINEFMIQGGSYYYTEDGSLDFKLTSSNVFGEFKANGYTANDISHVRGTLSMARATDYNSGSSQFFICDADCAWLDGNYAAFGMVTDDKSLDVVKKIAGSETTTVGSLRDFPVNPISIKKVKLQNKKFR